MRALKARIECFSLNEKKNFGVRRYLEKSKKTMGDANRHESTDVHFSWWLPGEGRKRGENRERIRMAANLKGCVIKDLISTL